MKNLLYYRFLCRTVAMAIVLLSTGGFSQDPPEIAGYNVYFGMLHSHTRVSDGSGTPNQAYIYARDEAELDFFSIADHDYWPDDMTEDDWGQVIEAANRHNDDGNYTTFWGFEWTSDNDVQGSQGVGHITIIGTQDYTFSYKGSAATLDGLSAWLDERDAIAIFNHPGQYGTDFSFFEFDYTDRIVGIELWNRSNDYYTDEDWFDMALGKGWYIGASGSDDNHDASWGTTNDWRMAVFSNELTRDSIFAALKARRFYSVRDGNLVISFTCNGQQMGSRIPADTLNCNIQGFDGDDEVFTRIDLVKNGELEDSWDPDETQLDVTWRGAGEPDDYFYVRAYQGGNAWRAISSPIFLTDDPVSTLPGYIHKPLPFNYSRKVVLQTGGTEIHFSGNPNSLFQLRDTQGRVLETLASDDSGLLIIPGNSVRQGIYFLQLKNRFR